MERQGWLIVAVLMTSMMGGALSNAWLTVGLGAQGGDVLTASQVIIVDSSGRLRAVIAGEDERGLTSLAFYGQDGAFRGVLGADANGDPVLQFNNAAGFSRLSAGVQDDNALVTVGDQGAGHVLVGSLGGSPIVGLADMQRTPLRLTLGQGGQPQVSLFNGAGQRSLGLAVGADDAPFVSLFDGAGAQRVAIGAVEGATLINLGDGIRPRLVLGVADNGLPSVGFYDEEGTLVRSVAAGEQ